MSGVKFKIPGGWGVSYDGSRKSSVGARSNYGVTPIGKIKAEEGELAGAQGKVLGAVNDLSFCTPTEIATETGLPLERVTQVLKTLIKRGFIREQRGGE